ncbi:MAG TPA: CoA-binding protein [Flavihumibacter sp.]|nr:CoA-binding protein [Bacteroidota bacterium]HOA38254.1 CoA-binding protein [Flavihumibacter sp.]HPZ88986.1 CoA-binding protein [Flavihumibacter sp.]HQD09651.1 CoA-binding protein [Flavihumibacter sp.]
MSSKKTLVMGASANPERYSYLAINKLRAHGHPVEAIGRKAVQVKDVLVRTGTDSLKDIDTVTMYLSAENQQPYYDYILGLHPKRIIFNPGAENEELAAKAKALGIYPQEACTLVLLSTGQY